MDKQSNLTSIITVAFLSTVFVIFIYSLGFFTNLTHIRGVDRALHDMYQSFIRIIFDFSLIGIVLVLIRKGVVSQLKEKNSILQFFIGALIAAIVICLSVFSLLKMGTFIKLYQGVDIDKVLVFYRNYKYNDSVFYIGYFLNSATLLLSIVFLIMSGKQTSWRPKEINK